MSSLRVRFVGALMAVGFGLVTSVLNAEIIATPLKGDTRLVQFRFDDDNTYLVLAKPKAVTHIQFGPDEAIKSIAAGDTQNWELSPTKDRKNLFVKPRFDDEETSLSVITDKRTYQFILRSTGDGKKWYQRVSWLYPTNLVLEEPDSGAVPSINPVTPAGGNGHLAPNMLRPVQPNPDYQSSLGIDLGGIKPEALRFGYTIKGDALFRPEMVFDDGKFTYLRMPANLQELPALFAGVDSEDFALVNYTVRGDYLIAQRLAEKFLLKLGKSEAVVIKPEVKKSWFSVFNRDGG